MRVLFLGGTGNISAEVSALMARRGHEVTVVSRGNRPVPKEYGHIVADRHDENSLRDAVKDWKGDAVLDFICYKKPQAEIAHNVFKGRIAHYLFISTCMIYKKEPGRLPITEDFPQEGRFSEYARLKIECESYFLGVNGLDFPVTIVRPSHTLGIGKMALPLPDNGFTVPARILAGRPVIVPNDGQSLWTITASSDFAVGMAGLVGNSKAVGEAFHITSDQAVTWNCVYHEIGLALGREAIVVRMPVDFMCQEYPHLEASLKSDRAKSLVFDNLKIKRFVPEFECVKSPRQIIRDSVAWFNEDPARKAIKPEVNEMIDTLLAKWRQAQS